MPNNPPTQWHLSNPEKMAKYFSRIGWFGFWLQLAMLLIPILLLIYVLIIGSPESAQRKGIDLSSYLSYGSLLVLLFTTFWFYRYTRLAGKISDPQLRPTQASVEKTIWTGLGAIFLGISFSMILMTNAVGRFLFVLLATPQTGVPFSQTGGDPAMTLSAIDAVALMSLLFSLFAELIVLALSMWLLFRVTRRSDKSVVIPAS
ncbi:MAG: DUF3611 family protein [Desulfobacterales bacterium]